MRRRIRKLKASLHHREKQRLRKIMTSKSEHHCLVNVVGREKTIFTVTWEKRKRLTLRQSEPLTDWEEIEEPDDAIRYGKVCAPSDEVWDDSGGLFHPPTSLNRLYPGKRILRKPRRFLLDNWLFSDPLFSTRKKERGRKNIPKFRLRKIGTTILPLSLLST